MQTFLIVCAIIALTVFLLGAYAVAKVKSLGTRALVYILNQGILALKEKAQEAYVSDEIRGRLASLETEASKLPPIQSIGVFNYGEVLNSAKPLLEQLAQISDDISKAAPQPSENNDMLQLTAGNAEPPAVEDDATAAEKAQHDAILTTFKAEYVKPEHGIVDAWVEFKNGEHWLVYQLDAEKGSEIELGKVPSEYQGLTTIITWSPKGS